MTQLTTGQPTVDAIGKLNLLEGSYVPHTWLKHLTYTNKRGTYTHHLAVLLLADIVYWYRPTVVKDEQTGEILGWKKKFKDDKLQRSYEAIAAHLGATYRQAREAVLFLKDIGLITAEFRNFTTKTGLFVSNALYLEPVAEKVSQITYSIKNEPHSEIGKPYSEIGKRSAEIGRTYTDISPNISPKTSEINTHIRQADHVRVSDSDIVADLGKEKEVSQSTDKFVDRVIPDPPKPTVRRREPLVAKKSAGKDTSSATFEKPEQLKLVEYVEELPLNSDGTYRFPWNKRGSARHCPKFAQYLFENHLYKCDGYKDGRGFESHRVQVLKYLDEAKTDDLRAEITIDWWNSYVESRKPPQPEPSPESPRM